MRIIALIIFALLVLISYASSGKTSSAARSNEQAISTAGFPVNAYTFVSANQFS